ncbi:MAG: hypothetical protein Q7T03_01090, partial [Deltaproteobacteria bacterium]|nr:hypothetical protein [Deltaproteobacteria bacterium]
MLMDCGHIISINVFNGIPRGIEMASDAIVVDAGRSLARQCDNLSRGAGDDSSRFVTALARDALVSAPDSEVLRRVLMGL